MKLVVETATILNIAFGSLALALLALFLKGLHSAYLYDKNMRILDRDHQEYLKTAPKEGVNIFRAKPGVLCEEAEEEAEEEAPHGL